jgi:hypothetical protein
MFVGWCVVFDRDALRTRRPDDENTIVTTSRRQSAARRLN